MSAEDLQPENAKPGTGAENEAGDPGEEGFVGKAPIIIDILLDDPQKHPNNIYEIVGALPYNITQVLPAQLVEDLRGEIPTREISVFCSNIAKSNIKVDGLGHPESKWRYYDRSNYWPDEKTIFAFLTTPFIDFNKIRDENPHIHSNETVFTVEKRRDLEGNEFESFFFKFVNPHLEKKLKAKREKVLIDAIIWFKNLRKDQMLINKKMSFMKILSLLELYPYIRFNKSAGQYEIQEDAYNELVEAAEPVIKIYR